MGKNNEELRTRAEQPEKKERKKTRIKTYKTLKERILIGRIDVSQKQQQRQQHDVLPTYSFA